MHYTIVCNVYILWDVQRFERIQMEDDLICKALRQFLKADRVNFGNTLPKVQLIDVQTK